MGEAAEVFTPEEKVILGEEAEPQTADQDKPPVTDGEKPVEGEALPAAEAKPDATKPPEHSEEEKQAAEKMGLKIDEKGFIVDEEGTRIPAKRWKEVYWQYKEASRGRDQALADKSNTERKLKLFQVLGPDKYYGIYPDEKPEGYQPAAAEAKPTAEVDPLDLVATYPDPNHPYHGMTLREIYKQDAAEGRRLERVWERGQREQEISARRQQETEAQAHQRALRESETEVTDFASYLSKDLFGKDFSTLSAEEVGKINSAIKETLDFMMTTRRGSGLLSDAYLIMHKDDILTAARTKGGQAAIESLKKPSVPSINSAGGAATTTMNAFESMSPDQLATAIEGMTDKQYKSFIKNASASLKAKNPGIPWD